MPHRAYDVRTALLDSLMSKVEDDPYPSVSMLDLIEELLTAEEKPRYVRLLLSKVADENFPSMSMLTRIRDLALA